MRTLRLLNLHCNKIDNDDNTKVNETILTVENGKFHEFGPESMMNGSDWDIHVDIQFNEQAIVSFFDVRTHIVEENEIREGQKKISFTSDNANYVLTYEII